MILTPVKKSVKLSRSQISRFQKMIWDYYEKQGRHDLPWRLTGDPYAIFVSEVMLQQTQVPRVLIKYPEFMAMFPDIQTLAHAPLTRILNVWQGMGYNRRTMFLKKAAQKISTEYGNMIPDTASALIQLPGIGKHTAGSIMAFAFNLPVVFIETNIRRTFIHHFFTDTTGISDEDIYPLVEATLPKGRSRDWYSALMDYGTFLAKTIINPNHKSRHYKKQSPFEVSLRKVRGEILKLASAHDGKLSRKDVQALPFDTPRVTRALESLLAEGFIVKYKTGYRIVE